MHRRLAMVLLTTAAAFLAAACGGASVDAVSTPGNVADIRIQVGMKQLEMTLLACHAEAETFVGCPLQPVDGIEPSLTATSFVLRAGSTVSRFDAARDTVPCHATDEAPTNCAGW